IKELDKEKEEELEKFEKAIKERMLDDLSSWALDPEGFFYRVDGGLESLNLGGIVSKCVGIICLGNKDYRNEIVNGFINEIKQNPQDWKIRRAKPEETIYAEIENALNHKQNDIPIIKKKENYVCDACCQKQSYNIAFLIGVRDFINDTEIFLKRFRRLITKLPKFYDKLKDVEKSLILTDEEKQAEKKNHSFRINFLQEKNGGRQRDNIHLFKLCRKCLDELAEKEKVFFSENPDVKKVGEK
ncbi:19933_t:CDS:2, partial [Funneliformis geosporum]